MVARRDPRLVADYARLWAGGRRAASIATRTPGAPVVSPEEASGIVARLLGEAAPGPAYGLAAGAEEAGRSRGSSWAITAADSGLGELAYAVTRAVRPDAVVETGVAMGLTSAYILAALSDNGRGELHSIDLPPPRMVAADLVGAAIPPALRGRWRYHWGSSGRLLSGVLRETAGGRRVFLHDSDHSYRNMRWELETAWRALSPGDVLLCDDANFHTGFVDAVRGLAGEPRLAAQREKGGVSGFAIRAES
jgi:predicted O-methyltransferase YrrM